MENIMEGDNPIITDPWFHLGVPHAATPDEIKRARNTLALTIHPDKCPDPSLLPQWTARMALLNTAFDLATNPAQWSAYCTQHHVQDTNAIPNLPPAKPSERAAHAQARQAAATSHNAAHEETRSATRRERREKLKARIDALDDEGSNSAPGATERLTNYLQAQIRRESDDVAERVAAREERDATVAAEDLHRAALIATAGEDQGLLLDALYVDMSGHKGRKVGRRMLAGEAMDKREEMRERWEGRDVEKKRMQREIWGVEERLTIQMGDADDEEDGEEKMRREAAERERIEVARMKEELKRKWAGQFGNKPKEEKPVVPMSRAEKRKMKKIAGK